MPCWIVPRGDGELLDARAYVCVPVVESTLARSDLLQGLVEAGGTVELPEAVSVVEFLAWARLKLSDVATLTPDETCRALHVRFRIRCMSHHM